MSYASDAQFHSARAEAALDALEKAEARNAQLEDELSVATQATLDAYEYVKPPVNIDTSTKTIVDSGGGGVDLPDPVGSQARSSALAIVAVVVGVIGVLLSVWLLLKRKGAR